MDYSRMHLRAPLLWLLLPLVVGYALGEWVSVTGWAVLFGAGFTLVIGGCGVLWLARGWGTWLWLVVFPLGVVCMGWGYYEWRNLSMVPWAGKTPREAVVVVRVERLFATADDSPVCSGTGVVREAPDYARELVGRRIYVAFNRKSESVVRTEVVRVAGVLRPLDSIAQSPGFIKYMRNLGLSAGIKQGRLLEVVEPGTAFQRFCARQKLRLTAALKAGAEPGNPYAGIFAGMMLGDKAELDPEWRTAYLQTGTMHLFAISGLHVVAIAGCISLFLGFVRIPLLPRVAIGLVLLTLYVEITGAAPSAVRALLMVYGYWLGKAVARQSTPFAAWTGSAMFVLLCEPRLLWDAGFQLSYLVVAGILLYGAPLSLWAEKLWQPYVLIPYANRTWGQRKLEEVYRWTVSALAVSVAASVASVPLTIMHFQTLPLVSLLLNLVLVPLSALIVITGMVSMALGLCGWMSAAGFVNHAAWLQIDLMNRSIGAAQPLPGAWFTLSFARAEVGLLLAGLLFATFLTVVPLNKKRPGAGWLLPLAVLVVGLDAALFLLPLGFM
ncbi:MAG: ComEC/Rec2 family competence protein [Verrucomicrobiota bacterium]|nr:ComEC/Rec2 family competence protein [Verrucomicrobiota bacterium]